MNFTPQLNDQLPIIYISNIPDEMEWNDIRKIISQWGRVHRVTIKKNKYNFKYAIVSFYVWNMNARISRSILLNGESVILYYTTSKNEKRHFKITKFIPRIINENSQSNYRILSNIDNNVIDRPPSPDYPPPDDI
jgi:hypothetical protein